MAALPDEKHERLAQLIAKGETQAVAYVNAGFSAKNSRVAASACNRLLKNRPEINDRALELQAIAREKGVEIEAATFLGDMATFTRMFLEDRIFAKQCGQPGAAVSATNGLLKLYGPGEETVRHKGAIENKITIDPSKLSNATMEELLAARRRTESESD